MNLSHRLSERIRRRPISALTTAVLGVWHVVFGIWLGLMQKTAARVHSFKGPLTFFDYGVWMWLFIIGGALMLLTLVAPESRHRLELIVPAFPTLAWAGGWWAGPISTAQPTYTLIALAVIGQPWIYQIASRYLYMEPHD